MDYNQLLEAFIETIYITTIVSFMCFFSGIALGALLFSLQSNRLFENKVAYSVLSFIVNVLRSIPFIILLIILMPLTNLLVGSITGANAAIPALVIGCTPMFARLVENTLIDLPVNLQELGVVLKLNKIQLLRKVLLKESFPNILGNFTTMIITIIGYGAMAGVIGAGGLGSFAYSYGFQRSNQLAVLLSTLLILLLVFIVDQVSKIIIRRIDYR